MSKVFIARPVFAMVISIVIVIAGLVAMRALPIARYPEIAPPTVAVTALYPGADAETVAETLATPLELEINGVEGMLYMNSVSGSDGSLTINVVFDVGVNIDMAQVFVQNRVQTAMPRLPEEATRQVVTVKKRSVEITAFIVLYSPEGAFDDLFLSNFATLRVKDENTRVRGVGDVALFGAADFGMRVWLDPDALNSRGLSVTDVLGAIRGQNVQVAAGRIGAPPAPEGQVTDFAVTVRGRLTDPEEFGAIVLRTGGAGELVHLRDVARVELGAENYSQIARFNGAPAAVLAVYQLPGANAIDVVNGLRARMASLGPAFPEGVAYNIAYESTGVIEASIREVLKTLLEAIVLVVITIYVFLQSFRATLIPLATIPVSLIGTLAVMLMLGFSINILTLFGLLLAIGVVVDDAIVVVENVTRRLDEHGETPREATIAAMKEVTGPIIATTFVLLGVFVPTAFLPGIQGQMFRQFALTIAISTVFSSINALSLSPALSAILLRPSPEKPFLPFRLFNRFVDGMTAGYAGVIKASIRVAPVTLVVFAGLAGAALLGFSRLPGGFIPQEDEGWAMTAVQLPDGASQERTNAVMLRVEEIARGVPGVASVLSIAGFSIVDNSVASNVGTVFTIFEPWGDRTSDETGQDAIIGAFNRGYASIQEGAAVAFPLPSLPGMGNSAGLSGMIEDRASAGLWALEGAVREMTIAGATQSMFQRVFSTFRATSPRLYVDIDREAVQSRGVAMQDVFDTLGSALGSAYVNDFIRFGRIFQVRVQAEAARRALPGDIARLEVRGRDGAMIPSGAIAAVHETVAPSIVTRYNVYPAARLMMTPAPLVTTGQAIALADQMDAATLPPGFVMEWTELALQATKAGSPIGVFILAAVLVYLALAAQYESWTLPISVILAIPTGLLGAVAMLMVLSMDNNVYTQIGVVLLIGLSAKGSILIVEFAREKRAHGLSTRDAAVEASRLRLRAIVMTALAFILGVLPLLGSSGAGAESREAIGAAVFGGMIAATLGTLLFVPSLYFLVQRGAELLRPSKAGEQTEAKASPPSEPAPT